MVWGIIGALATEVDAVKKRLDQKHTQEHWGRVYEIGMIDTEQVVVVESSIGKINAAICAYTLIEKFKVDALINIGIAGALEHSLHICDVVVGTELLFHDLSHTTYHKYFPYNTIFPCDKTLVQRCVEAIERLPFPPHYVCGRIITGDRFVESTSHKKELLEAFKPLCVEMEGAAIAQVAHTSQTPFLVLRTISDKADDGAKETYDLKFECAADISAQIMIATISGSKSQQLYNQDGGTTC